MSATCKNCRFWTDGDDGWAHLGRCRRNAPSPSVLKARGLSENEIAWPSTMSRDWCGEHRPKETGQIEADQPAKVDA